MEKQDEKQIKVCIRQRRSNPSSSSLPLDLVSEILLRLPEKSVVRFRCVSKSWSSITTDPYFINLYKARSPPLLLLLCFKANDKLFVFSGPQHHQIFETPNKTYSSFEPIDRYHMEVPIDSFNHPKTESVQGLICFQKSAATPIVWNPSARQKITLTKPSESWNDLRILLGYDPVESKHKVMCVPLARSSDECRVLTLGSAQEESWRTVKTNLNTCPADYTSGRCIKGVVYYIAYVDLGPTYVLMSFDVRSEKFDKIQLPPSEIYQDALLTYQGKIAFIDRKQHMENGIRLWIFEDAEKHNKWSSKDFLSPHNHPDKITGCHRPDKNTRCHRRLIGFTHTGEFIFAENMSCILFYDPVKNSFRRFDLKGITDDNSDTYELFNVFPNHVESRISL